MSKAYAESRAKRAQEQRRREEEQKKRQKQQAQASKSAGKSAAGGALRGAMASKSSGKAYKPAVESPSYDWLGGTTRTPSQFGQKAYDDSRATPYQQYMHNADAISSADALNRYMQQASDYFNNTYTDRNAGMKLRNSGLMSGVQGANAAGQKVQQYFSSNPQIYSNGKYAEEKANYDRISSEVADPALDYKLRARTGDASVFNENMDDTTRSQARRYFRQSQFENFTNAMKKSIANGGHVGGSAQKQYSDREIAEIMAGKVPDFKATQAVTGGADTYQGVADMQSAYSRDQVASDVETVTYQDGTAREIQAAAERLDALVGSGYSARLRQNWSKDPNVRMEALNAYDANEQMLSNYYDQTVGANSPDEVKTTYEDYKNYLVGYNKQLAKEAKDEKLRQQLEADFGGKVQSANAKKSSGGTVAAAFAGLRGQEATKKQQGVYTMIADGYDAARKAGYIDEWQDAQGHDPVTREYYDSGYDHMTDEEKDNFISLYNDPTQGPEVAFEYLNRLKYFTQQRDAYEMEKWTSDLAQNGFLGAAAATGVGIAAGYANNAASLYVMTDRLINGDQDGKYNEYSPELRYSLIHDVALGTVGQVIEDAAPNLELAGINVPKAFYNAATSAAESFLNTVSFGHFGAVAMGVGAAGSSYRSNLEKVGSVDGYTEKDAFIDGAFDGFVETLTEYVSVENLLNPTLNPKKNVLRAMWTEPSEEVLGWLLDNGYDTIKYGSRGEIAQRYDELLVQGYSDAEARATITQEMAQELTETILVAGLSGGMMGGPQAIATQVENSRVGSEVRKNDNVTGLLDLADTLELPKDVQRMSAEQRSAAEKGEKVSSAKLGRILRESMAKLDESGRQILSESAEKLAKRVLLENGYDGDDVNLNALAKKVVRLVSGQGVTELEMKDVARSDAATRAVQALTERTADLKKIGDKFGKLDSLMKPREAAQTEISERLREASAPQKVTEAFDEAVAKADEAVAKATEAAESDALSAEEERAVRLESFASEYGENADVMQNAISEGQDVDAYARAFKVAEVRGEDGQSFDVVKKLSVLSDLTENQVRIAYELGRGIRGARSAQLRQNTNYSGAQVQVGNVDTSAIKGHLTSAQQRSIDAARSVAQALGVNIRFFESTANEIGQYTAENGSFDGDTMTISLDIHAGSNSKFSTDYAVMQTLGHELTHFVKSFADSEVFNAYQDFVIGHLSEKMDVDAEVERVTALASERGVNLSRDGAIEEIIANASGEALMNITQEQIAQLAQANPSLAKRIGNRIQEWVKKVLDRIRAAYKGGSVKYEVARQMQDVLTEMSEKWNNALVNAAQNRFGTKGQQQETVQQAETAVENAVENSETAHAEEPVGKTEALAENAQEKTESKPQPIAGRHIDQRTTDSVKGVDMDLFSSESERIQIGFAEAAKILLADLNSTIRGDKTFVSDGGADQTVLGQKRMTSALLEEIKDQTGWTWERIGKSLRAFVLAGETGDLVKNTVTNRTMELYLNEMLTEGYTTLEGVNLTPWGEYVDFVQGLEGAKEHAVREVKGAIPFEDYAFADVEQAAEEEGNDLRFQLRYQDDANQISDRELLASALDTVAQNDTERDYLKRYRKYIKELEQKQTQLDDLSARLKDLKADKASAKANRDLIMRMENNAKTLENSIQRTDKRLLDFEATKALKDVMAREKAAWKQTAKARSDARVARLRESNRANTQARVDAARERVRASYERKLEAKLEKAQAAMEKKTDRIVGRLENKLERNEARFEERIAKMKESEKRTEYRRRILEDSAAMREWLTTPTNKAHVPEFLRAPLGDFLKSINYSSDSLLRGKGETKADAALIDAMERMSRALAQTRTQPDSLSTAEGYMGYLDLPSGFESEFNEMLDRVKGAIESGADVTDTPLNRMTSAQLKTLSDAIRTLNTSVRNMNRLIANGRYQTARDASASTIEELTKLGDRKKTGAVRDALSGWIDWKSATPFYAFQRFGEGGKAIFEGIQDGWDRMAFNVKQVLDFTKSAYTPKQVRQWSRETHSVELSSKKKVQMTTAQLMSLYCLSRREQAMKHLQGGGIRIASFKTKGGTVNQAENYTLSTADISKLTGMLTSEQIEVADKLQAFMSSVCADWGNEVSMQRFGYNAFTEENYFPIETDSNNRAAVDESARENDLFRLLNLSATKALVQNANNAVMIQDIFDVFAAHAADMAKYNGLALPILDTLKWYNYVEKTRPVNGQFTTQSVQKSLEAAYGRDAQKYVTNFLRDLNGKREGGRNDGLINRMISNYKVAAVGANLRVGFLQITSMPRAAYVISPKYLAIGVAKNVAFRNSPIAERKVGIALWKSLGFYDTNISRNIRDLIKNDAGFFENVRDLSMTPAEKGDYWTMGVLYGAVEAEMADRHADVKKNTAKYDQMVNDRMREIIYKTQVVDSTMTRSDIMRGKGLASIASAFMSEPTLTMNLLSESVYEARMKARAGDSKSVAQALVGSRKFGKALAATTVVCALSAVFEAVFSAYRDDDEYETFLEKFNDALVGDLSGADGGWEKFQAFWNGSIMDNFKLWNNIVFVKDISEALAGDSGDAAMWAAGFGDLAKGVQQLYKSILGDGGKPLYGSIYTTLKGVSELSGIPMSAATRDTIGLYNTIAGEMGWKRLQTSNDKPSDAAEAILRVEENGNTVLADRYRRIAGEHGIDEAKLQSAMKSAIQSRFDAERIEDQRAAELLEDYAGKDAEDAGMQVSRWRYAKDTGLKYSDMKEDYLSGLLDEATALRYLTAEIGADKAAARIDRWNFEQLHGEDADYSSRWKLWEAFEGSGSYDGKTAEQYVREWAKATDKKNIAAAIAGRYKDEYLRIKGTPSGNRMLEKLLNLYVAAGYEREYEREYIDKKWVK